MDMIYNVSKFQAVRMGSVAEARKPGSDRVHGVVSPSRDCFRGPREAGSGDWFLEEVTAVSAGDIAKEILDGQRRVWDSSFVEVESMFGDGESFSARRAALAFRRAGVQHVLELGCGQGRDSLYFARKGFDVTAVDYSRAGLETLLNRAAVEGTERKITVVEADLRIALPFEDGTFDACYSHMLFCMAFSFRDLFFLSAEIRRVLGDGGLNIYTVRTKKDPHWRQGVHRGEEMYEMGGYIVRFFDRADVALLAQGYAISEISEFQEGALPRELYYVEEAKRNLPPPDDMA